LNPLLEIRMDGNLVKDVQNIATMIVDPDGKGLNDHWAKTGFDLMTGVVLFVLLFDWTTVGKDSGPQVGSDVLELPHVRDPHHRLLVRLRPGHHTTISRSRLGCSFLTSPPISQRRKLLATVKGYLKHHAVQNSQGRCLPRQSRTCARCNADHD